MSVARPNSENKRSEHQKLADRVFIADKRIQGWDYRRIAVALNKEREGLYTLSHQTVNTDMKSVEKEWLARLEADARAIIARQAASLDRMEDELWSEWERSKVQRRRATVEITHGPAVPEGQDPSPDRRKSTVLTEDAFGDPRFMELLLRVQERRAKLLGLNAPIKISGPNGEPITSTPSIPEFHIHIDSPRTEAERREIEESPP